MSTTFEEHHEQITGGDWDELEAALMKGYNSRYLEELVWRVCQVLGEHPDGLVGMLAVLFSHYGGYYENVCMIGKECDTQCIKMVGDLPDGWSLSYGTHVESDEEDEPEGDYH
jgi:hypothetical protein